MKEKELILDENTESIEAVPHASYTRPIQLKSPQMYGEDVKAVQNRLNALKYNAGTADGYYGPSGVAAVKDFQGVNGMAVDGSVGPATWDKLFSSTAKPKPSGGNSGYTRPIQLKSPQMYGEDVKAVQRKLNSLGHNAGDVDGYYGTSGVEAVKRFQKSEGLSIDGSVGPTTWNKLFEGNAYQYKVHKVNGLTFHIIETNLDNIETETILKPLANTKYIGLNGGLFDGPSKYDNPPTSGSSICYNHEDVGKYVTVEGSKRIANFHENQISDEAVDQRTLIIYRSGGTVKAKIQNMKHVNTAFSAVGESNVLNVIGGTSPELTSGVSAMAPIGRAAISVNGSKAYLLYCPMGSQVVFNNALDTGLGRGITRANTVMMDGSGSAGMNNGSEYIGSDKRYIYNIIRVRA